MPVQETRTEPKRESLSTRLNEAQQEVHTQPAPDARYFLALVCQFVTISSPILHLGLLISQDLFSQTFG